MGLADNADVLHPDASGNICLMLSMSKTDQHYDLLIPVGLFVVFVCAPPPPPPPTHPPTHTHTHTHTHTPPHPSPTPTHTPHTTF
jgi:hypothetical protein